MFVFISISTFGEEDIDINEDDHLDFYKKNIFHVHQTFITHYFSTNKNQFMILKHFPIAGTNIKSDGVQCSSPSMGTVGN